MFQFPELSSVGPPGPVQCAYILCPTGNVGQTIYAHFTSRHNGPGREVLEEMCLNRGKVAFARPAAARRNKTCAG